MVWGPGRLYLKLWGSGGRCLYALLYQSPLGGCLRRYIIPWIMYHVLCKFCVLWTRILWCINYLFEFYEINVHLISRYSAYLNLGRTSVCTQHGLGIQQSLLAFKALLLWYFKFISFNLALEKSSSFSQILRELFSRFLSLLCFMSRNNFF